MPSAGLDFRAACGCFLPVYQCFMMKRVRQRIAMRIAILKLKRRVDGVVAGLLLSYLFWGSILLQCGDVESNPGPPAPPDPPSTQSKGMMVQTRLSSKGSTSSRSSMDRPGRSEDGASNQPGKAPTLSDVVNMLHAQNSRMDTGFDELKQEVHDVKQQVHEVQQEVQVLREEYAAMQDELRGLRDEVSGLRQQNQELQQRNDDLAEKIDGLGKMTDDLEGRSKRNNVIFYGLHRRENETAAECEDMVKDLITDKLELSHDFEFDRVHRLSSKPDAPVIARCTFYKHKIDLLKAKRKLQGTNIFIGEDFSLRVRDMRRKLTPRL
eukprot:TRINITY_DN1257_c0_g1_i6.p1 TRINITY_DN1257_c0_g1~~TRINITY_DN1257_c0_g1_i6.p1  ORF type:complete len:323 (-),score=63.13 TRINITY_DN1257_c0_g1_i6:203-1171(-)